MAFVFRKRFPAITQQFAATFNQLPKGFATLTESKNEIIDRRQNEDILVKQWWSQPAFGLRAELEQPVYDVVSGEKNGDLIRLSSDIFGKPLRRDIVHNVYHHERNWQRKTTHRTKTQSEISGSGQKPLKQKGTGRARQGNKRAPGRKGGAKAHGPVPRDYTQHLPQKMVLLGLKTILSARLAEGRFRVINEPSLDEGRTQVLSSALSEYREGNHILLVHGGDVETNFEQAQRNLRYITMIDAVEITLTDILKSQFLFITREGLDKLENSIIEREEEMYRNKKIPLKRKYSEEKPTFTAKELDGYKIKSKSLQKYQYLFNGEEESENQMDSDEDFVT